MREMALRRKAKLVADIGDRRLGCRQPIERPLDTHGVSVERRSYAGVFTKQFIKMRPRKAGVARHAVQFHAVSNAVVQEPERLAYPKVDRCAGSIGPVRPAISPPGFVKAGVEQLIQISIDDAITRIRHQRVGEAYGDGANCCSNPDAVGAETEAAAAFMIAIEPAVADIGDQKDRRLVGGARLKVV